jgi:hypothetical protein
VTRSATGEKRIEPRQLQKESQVATSPDAGASAASGSGGDAAFIQDSRSDRRDHDLIPFASERIGGAVVIGLNAPAQAPKFRPAVALTASKVCQSVAPTAPSHRR